jgi:hypothetical protein
MITCSAMHKVSRGSVFGLAVLTGFGVAYDSGLFGTPDGYDHSAVISIAPSTSTVSMSMYAVMNNTTGEDILIHQSEAIKAQTTKV